MNSQNHLQLETRQGWPGSDAWTKTAWSGHAAVLDRFCHSVIWLDYWHWLLSLDWPACLLSTHVHSPKRCGASKKKRMLVWCCNSETKYLVSFSFCLFLHRSSSAGWHQLKVVNNTVRPSSQPQTLEGNLQRRPCDGDQSCPGFVANIKWEAASQHGSASTHRIVLWLLEHRTNPNRIMYFSLKVERRYSCKMKLHESKEAGL